MKLAALTCCIALLFSCQNKAQSTMATTTNTSRSMTTQSIYEFKVEDLSGNTFDFASLKGKKILIVNTASKCGYTPQYEQLEAVYNKYKNKNLVIIGFPANNFMWQEPGTNAEIATFCKSKYGVTFPMMAKISVKGKDIHPIYQFLTQKKLNGVLDSKVEWNFQKYLINEKGQLEQVYMSGVKPNDEKIINWIEK
jgi:glutathione peroxidase